LDEVARMCEADVPPPVFYGEMLKRLLESLAAPAGAIWTRTPQGHLQLQFHINMKEVGLDRTEQARESHDELLRHAILKPGPLHLLPHSGMGGGQEGKQPPGNPTDFLLLMVPIMQNDQVHGLIEVWQGPNRPRNAIPGFLQFMKLMAELATRYQRNQMLGQMTGQQQLWTQLETFARQVHGSLNPVEVSYHVANEGRRLIECDRVSVALRYGRNTVIECVSGTDVVEKRSNLVRLMRKLADRVLDWGEQLTFTGSKDDALPPKVADALDAYLAESGSKLLVVQPLKDERDKDKDRPTRAALVMECFDPPAEPQQIIARLEVVSRHATSALYNAVELKRIPMRFVWMPLARMQEGLGGKARAISALVVVALSFLISAMVLVPYPLKMSATGELLPKVRQKIHSKREVSTIKYFLVKPGQTVNEQVALAEMWDLELFNKQVALDKEIESLKDQLEALQKSKSNEFDPAKKNEIETKRATIYPELKAKQELRDKLYSEFNAIPERPGYFLLKSPRFAPDVAGLHQWKVLNSNNLEEEKERQVKGSDEILRLGAPEGPWEIELKIPQKHIGQVRQAYDRLGVDELDVDFLMQTDKTQTFRGRLHRDDIAAQANPNKDDNNEPDPVVIARVRLEGDGIPPDMQLPRDWYLSGVEVHAKVICGKRAMGYSLFYGLWEFFYEKVVFYF
jgi:DNA-binding response OmpR family regulator